MQSAEKVGSAVGRVSLPVKISLNIYNSKTSAMKRKLLALPLGSEEEKVIALSIFAIQDYKKRFAQFNLCIFNAYLTKYAK